KAMAAGSGTVQIDATVTPMQTKQTKRHTVVDLSDRLLYAYENDQVVQTFHVVIGRGNNSDGSCGGDFCTPEGDYKIFQRVENQTMTGNVVRSDGTVEKWSVPNVGWANYFTHDGCAIHRISGSQQLTDADLATSTRWTHGCVGLGWDVAEWYYNWADYNETVHIQQ
ncbi:MAG: L,D-transpeptidase, partial [Bifidobacteriaceae bacterium]|nr:L,D-transpeptidase [Bifidobacteriaceae bacterium]